MLKRDKLRKATRDACYARGHMMNQYWFAPKSPDEGHEKIICNRCGWQAGYIDAPDSIQIVGKAATDICPYKTTNHDKVIHDAVATLRAKRIGPDEFRKLLALQVDQETVKNMTTFSRRSRNHEFKGV